MEVLQQALEDKDEEFQVIADALVEAEEAKARADRALKAQEEKGQSVAALREENERMAMELARLQAKVYEAENQDETAQKLQAAMLDRERQIVELQDEVSRLQAQAGDTGASNGVGNDAQRVSELEAELALSQRKLVRLEQTVIRLKGLRG